MPMSAAADRFHRTVEGFLDRIEAVPDNRWMAPTPCPRWTALDIVVHVINEQRRMLAAVTKTEPVPLLGVGVAGIGAIPDIAPGADLAAAWREIGYRMAHAIDHRTYQDVLLPMPAGDQPFAAIVELLPEDPLIHTWDLSRAVGLDERLDQDVVGATDVPVGDKS